MRILLIHQNFLEPEDGGGSRFNEMTRLWEEAGCDITVLAGMVHHATGEKPERYRGKYTYIHRFSGRRRVIRCHVSSAYGRGFVGRLWGYFSFVFSALYAGLFRAGGGYDLILATSPPLFVGITARLLSLLKRTPMVFEVRDLWPESAIDTGVLRNKAAIRLMYALEAMLYRRARLIVVLTPAFRQTLIERKGVPPGKILLLPNAADFELAEQIAEGFDSGAFRQAQGSTFRQAQGSAFRQAQGSTFRQAQGSAFRQILGWDEKLVLLYVGAHGVANRLMQVVDAAELLKDCPEVLFVFVGDGMRKPALQEAVVQRGLQNVQFIPIVPKSEVFKYILAADYGMSVLKKCDTFKTIYSNKTFDYMSCRKPVLLLIDGVSRELVVEQAQCGHYVEPENPALLAKTIREVLLRESKEQREKMGESGYQYAKKHFDRRVLAARYLEALGEV